jgi:hypothetical protein
MELDALSRNRESIVALAQIPKFGIVLVVGALGFRDRKETDVPLQLICSVSLIAKLGILEDEDDDKHEDDSSNSEFSFSKPPGFASL